MGGRIKSLVSPENGHQHRTHRKKGNNYGPQGSCVLRNRYRSQKNKLKIQGMDNQVDDYNSND